MAPHDGQHGPLCGGGHLQLRHAAGRGARGQVSTFCIRSHVDISTSGDTWPDQHSVTCHVTRSALCHVSRGHVSTPSRVTWTRQSQSCVVACCNAVWWWWGFTLCRWWVLNFVWAFEFYINFMSVTYDGFFSPIFLDLKHKSPLVTTVIMTHPS